MARALAIADLGIPAPASVAAIVDAEEVHAGAVAAGDDEQPAKRQRAETNHTIQIYRYTTSWPEEIFTRSVDLGTEQLLDVRWERPQKKRVRVGDPNDPTLEEDLGDIIEA